MRFIPVIRTRRLAVQLKELSIGEAIKVAGIHSNLNELSCTAFLKAAIVSAENALDNPEDWTIEERIFAVSHYLCAQNADKPDFAVGESAHYSDYLDAHTDKRFDAPVELGKVSGDQWAIRSLTGKMAESIERLQGEFPELAGRLHWIVGAMACQLVRSGEAEEEFNDESLLQKMRVFSAFPEADFLRLMMIFIEGRAKIAHLFLTDFADDGIVVLAKKTEGGEQRDLPAARFPAHSCLSDITRRMVGELV